MKRPTKFEEHRYLGDKRTQLVYDVDALEESEAHLIDDIMQAESFVCFAPDTLAEARNRGYRLYEGAAATS